MFEKIKDIWRSVRCTVFDKGTIKNAIGADVAMSSEMASVIQLWSDMYTDGGMLSLPAAIAREMARTISIEMKSKITGGKRAEFLNEKYTEVVADIRAPLEYGCAKGGLIFKPYVKDGNIAVDYIHADAFFPLAFDNSGKITAAVFAERIVKGSRYYTRLERHELKGKTYTISNKAYMSLNKSSLSNTVSLNSVSEWVCPCRRNIPHKHKKTAVWILQTSYSQYNRYKITFGRVCICGCGWINQRSGKTI